MTCKCYNERSQTNHDEVPQQEHDKRSTEQPLMQTRKSTIHYFTKPGPKIKTLVFGQKKSEPLLIRSI